eukprot:scaffold142299_cov21-Tisochrysis_lutea.AAC.1
MILDASNLAGQSADQIYDALQDNETTVQVFLVDEIIGTGLDGEVLVPLCSTPCEVGVGATSTTLSLLGAVGRGELVRTSPLISDANITQAEASGSLDIITYNYAFELVIELFCARVVPKGQSLEATASALEAEFTQRITDMAEALGLGLLSTSIR